MNKLHSNIWFYEYTTVLNMLGLHSSLNMPEYAWIYLNVPESLLFYIFHCNPLSKGFVDSFPEEKKFDFFYSSWKYLISFLFYAKCFHKLDLKFAVSFRGLGPVAVNLDIPNKYIYYAFLMIYSSVFIDVIVVVFPFFWFFKGLNQNFIKAVIL